MDSPMATEDEHANGAKQRTTRPRAETNGSSGKGARDLLGGLAGVMAAAGISGGGGGGGGGIVGVDPFSDDTVQFQMPHSYSGGV